MSFKAGVDNNIQQTTVVSPMSRVIELEVTLSICEESLLLPYTLSVCLLNCDWHDNNALFDL